jgi:hypothetical protein
VVEAHCSKLGTARKSVEGQIIFAQEQLDKYKMELDSKKSLLDVLD